MFQNQSQADNELMKSLDILLIEDNQDVTKIIADSIEAKLEGVANLNISFATNGLEASKILFNQKFDLILLDIHMPVMNGIEFLSNQKHNLDGTPVLVITATPDMIKEDPERALCVLGKPFNYSDLSDSIDRLLAS